MGIMARKVEEPKIPKTPPVTRLDIEWWDIERVIPYERNARVIPQKAVEKVALSLRNFGWRQPIVVEPGGVIIAGHARRMGALKNGWSQVPVHVATNLTPAQIKAYRLADNRTALESTFDDEILRLEFADLKELDIDLGSTGFDLPEVEKFLKVLEANDDLANETPEVPDVAVSRPGDLWVLGSHRLLCGDSTNAESVARLLDGVVPFIMVTDPPYGVEYDPAWRDEYGPSSSFSADAKPGKLGKRARGLVANDGRVDWSAAYAHFAGDVAYIWHADRFASAVQASIEAVDFEIRSQIIWRKQHAVFGRGAYHWQHEPCWYAVRKGGKASWRGDRKQTTVWDVENLNPMGGNREEESTGHGTQKPIELMRRPMLNHTKRGDSVYDPFLGSGTTLIAAEELGRVCYGLELDPKYVDVIVQRWEKFTGRRAGLADDGRTFEQVAADRSMEAAA